MFCLLVVLAKLSLLAKWLDRKTPPRKPNCGEGIISIKPRPKSAHDFLGLLYCFIVLLCICVVSCPYMIYYSVMVRYSLIVLKVPLNPKQTKQTNFGVVFFGFDDCPLAFAAFPLLTFTLFPTAFPSYLWLNSSAMSFQIALTFSCMFRHCWAPVHHTGKQNIQRSDAAVFENCYTQVLHMTCIPRFSTFGAEGDDEKMAFKNSDRSERSDSIWRKEVKGRMNTSGGLSWVFFCGTVIPCESLVLINNLRYKLLSDKMLVSTVTVCIWNGSY